MMSQHFISQERLIACLKTQYGITPSGLIQLAEGADLEAQAYKANTVGMDYFVKVKRGLKDTIGISVQFLLHDAGVMHVIAPFKTITNKPFATVDGCMVTVYPFVDGYDGFTRRIGKEQWVDLGNALRRIHAFDIPLSIKHKIRREDYSPQWREAVRSIYEQIESKRSNDRTILALLAFMKNHKEVIVRLVDTAEQLAKKIQKKNPNFVLCHSDIHAGNVLVQDKSTIFLVDWDSPIMAPKERDLMFIGGGVGNVWNDPREVGFFYQGYGSSEIDMEIIAYYRCERIIEDIAIYYQDLISSSTGNRAQIYRFLTDMFEPQGVVDKAFEAVNVLFPLKG